MCPVYWSTDLLPQILTFLGVSNIPSIWWWLKYKESNVPTSWASRFTSKLTLDLLNLKQRRHHQRTQRIKNKAYLHDSTPTTISTDTRVRFSIYSLHCGKDAIKHLYPPTYWVLTWRPSPRGWRHQWGEGAPPPGLTSSRTRSSWPYSWDHSEHRS